MAREALQRALDDQEERDSLFFKNLEVAVNNGVIRGFGR